jgi:type III pantothenate kinase
MNALSSGTSQLPKVPIEPPEKAINGNTIDAMKSGAIFGTAAMVDGMIDRFEEEWAKNAPLWQRAACRDGSSLTAGMTITHDPDLLLRGLGIIYEKNKKK